MNVIEFLFMLTTVLTVSGFITWVRVMLEYQQLYEDFDANKYEVTKNEKKHLTTTRKNVIL